MRKWLLATVGAAALGVVSLYAFGLDRVALI